jgi:tetratricopeptide (TPR) repeat protein
MFWFLALRDWVESVKSIKSMLALSNFLGAFTVADRTIRREGSTDADPLLFYLRGQASLQIGNYSEAVADMSRFLLSGKPDSETRPAALTTRAIASLKLGDLSSAAADSNITGDNSIRESLDQALTSLKMADICETSQDFKHALDHYIHLLMICPGAGYIMARAANAAWQVGNLTQFSQLLARARSIAPQHPQILCLSARYLIGEAQIASATKYLRRCDSQPCKDLIRGLRVFERHCEAAESAIAHKKFPTAFSELDQCDRFAATISNSSKLAIRMKSLRITILVAQGNTTAALDSLEYLLRLAPDNVELLLQRGALLSELGDYDGALADFFTARKIDPSDGRVTEHIRKTSDLQEAELSRSLYQVLGVKRTASASEIRAVFKAKVVQWHPDRYHDPIRKRLAEKKLRLINRAFDVLSDPIERRMYDQGILPDSPMQLAPPKRQRPRKPAQNVVKGLLSPISVSIGKRLRRSLRKRWRHPFH